ncbi:hypothetical protein ACFL20_12955 [Spirochaetota bacterium]
MKYKNDEERFASRRYSSIKSRVNYDLEKKWSREDFIKWWVAHDKKCCYCKCTIDELHKFYKITKSKRKSTRGKTLEVERKKDKKYKKDNCELCCYWCNNAKSDVFSYEEFINIGSEIGKVIRKKINK